MASDHGTRASDAPVTDQWFKDDERRMLWLRRRRRRRHASHAAHDHIHETKGPRHRLSRMAGGLMIHDSRARTNERSDRPTIYRISAAMHRAAYHDVPVWLTVGIQSAQRCTVGLASPV